MSLQNLLNFSARRFSLPFFSSTGLATGVSPSAPFQQLRWCHHHSTLPTGKALKVEFRHSGMKKWKDKNKVFVHKHRKSYLERYAPSIIFLLALGYTVWSIKGNKRVSAKEKDSEGKSKKNKNRERFDYFASLEKEGEKFMTPRDFIDSLVYEEPRPRIKNKYLRVEEFNRYLFWTPTIKMFEEQHCSKNPSLLRMLGDKGLITYSEYLFLCTLMTQSPQVYSFIFNAIDQSKDSAVDGLEFYNFFIKSVCVNDYCPSLDIITKKEDVEEMKIKTTLQKHFFFNNAKLSFDQFCQFVSAMQREVLIEEFQQFSKGLESISYNDFAAFLLRHTQMTENDYDSFMLKLQQEHHVERTTLSFEEVETFVRFLTNIKDFRFAYEVFCETNLMMREEFERAAKISLQGSGSGTLSKEIVNVIFLLFNELDSSHINFDKFYIVAKNRLHRQSRKSLNEKGFKAFKRCLRKQLRESSYA